MSPKKFERGELITQSALLERGWSKTTISLLGDADLNLPNPHGRKSPLMRLYELKRVVGYENTFDDWRKNANRSNASKKAADARRRVLLERIAEVAISIPRLDPNKVRADAITHYNSWSVGDSFAHAGDDEVFLARITLNYVRHELVQYDKAVDALFGLVGKREAYELLKDRVNQAAMEAYPEITRPSVAGAPSNRRCASSSNSVQKTREPIVITKHGRPVAQLASVPADNDSLFGYMKDTVRVEGDVMASVGEKWSALSGEEDHLYTRRSNKPSRKK